VEAANFILECKGDDDEAALEFLRGVLGALTGQSPVDPLAWDGAARGGPPFLASDEQSQAAHVALNQHHQQQSLLLQAQRAGVAPRALPVAPIALVGDEIDQRLSTLVILVPGRAHIVGHLIGKGGAEVGRIEREMSVTIKIESASKTSVALMERSVCIIGSVASTTLAQQYVSHKVHEKLLSEGVQAEVLKMVVPNEIVRHLIGKSGANINRLQNESGVRACLCGVTDVFRGPGPRAQARIQVEPESTMTSGALGRTIVLQGAERCRTFAQYLISRQVAEDRNVHAEWAGRAPSSSGGGSGAMAGHLPSPPPPSPQQPVPRQQHTPPPPSLASAAPSHQHPGNSSFMASIAGLGNGGGQAHVPRPLRATATTHFVPQVQRPVMVQQQQPQHLPLPDESDLVTIVMNIPEGTVAYLIGRNGAAIADIQNQSGAKINIAKPGQGGSEAGASGGRRVTMMGSSESVDLARLIIHQKLSMYRGMSNGAE
jgi:transcription antitermination factor NusA-like protein